MFKRLFGVMAAVAVLFPTLATATLNFTKITYNIPERKTNARFAADSNGNVLYEESGLGGENPLYKAQSPGSVPITIFGSDLTSRITGPVTLADNGDITFQTIDSPTRPGGAFLRTSGGVVLTLRGEAFSSARGAPATSRNGDVAFLSMGDPTHPQEQVVVTRSAGGITGTLPDLWLRGASRPSINNQGSVAVSGEISGISGGVVAGIVVARTRSIPLTVTGSNFRLTSSQPRIVENKDAVFATVQTNDPVSGLPTGKRQHRLFVPSPPSAGSPPSFLDYTIGDLVSPDSVGNWQMNDQYTLAGVDGDKLKVYLCGDTNHLRGSDPLTWTQITALTIGDALDGSTVTSIGLGEGSVLADNRVIFHATLADGSSGLYSILVPEPTSLALVGCSAALLRRRR